MLSVKNHEKNTTPAKCWYLPQSICTTLLPTSSMTPFPATEAGVSFPVWLEDEGAFISMATGKLISWCSFLSRSAVPSLGPAISTKQRGQVWRSIGGRKMRGTARGDNRCVSEPTDTSMCAPLWQCTGHEDVFHKHLAATQLLPVWTLQIVWSLRGR